MSMPTSREIGRRVQKARKARGLSAEGLTEELVAKGIVIERSPLASRESGRTRFLAQEIAAIADITGTTVAELILGEADRNKVLAQRYEEIVAHQHEINRLVALGQS